MTSDEVCSGNSEFLQEHPVLVAPNPTLKLSRLTALTSKKTFEAHRDARLICVDVKAFCNYSTAASDVPFIARTQGGSGPLCSRRVWEVKMSQ